MLSNGGRVINCSSGTYAECYLGDVEVEAKALSLPLHLPHTQLAGERAGAEAEPLQSERAVQVPLGTVPDVVERDLLQKRQGVTHTHTHTHMATQRHSQNRVSETRLQQHRPPRTHRAH